MICKRIHELRKKRGLTLDEVSGKLGIALNTYNYMEAGEFDNSDLVI